MSEESDKLREALREIRVELYMLDESTVETILLIIEAALSPQASKPVRRTYNDMTDEILLLRAENERLRTLAVETDRALEYCLTGVTIERCPSPGLLETTLGILRKTVASLDLEGTKE